MMKELVMEVTNALPNTATLEEIIDAIYMRLKIEQGINAVKNGEEYTEEEVLEEIKKW
ncbi:MAG: hypothetical protein HFJ30_00475 [Clostridia bacterium]|nr:hypothetical protein [Clostridia bacterium]